MRATVQQGAVVKTGAFVSAGAVVSAGTTIPSGVYFFYNPVLSSHQDSGEVWAGCPAVFQRKCTVGEIDTVNAVRDATTKLAALHADENSKSFAEVEQERLQRQLLAERDADYDSSLGKFYLSFLPVACDSQFQVSWVVRNSIPSKQQSSILTIKSNLTQVADYQRINFYYSVDHETMVFGEVTSDEARSKNGSVRQSFRCEKREQWQAVMSWRARYFSNNHPCLLLQHSEW
jgi:hypothetical protein